MSSVEKVIQISSLSKRFKDLLAVDELELHVNRGDVFGFLGPNGAGKSTTIRMMLSLVSPTSGTINIFGKSLLENRKEILTNIGAIVEKPDFYQYLPAIKNLEILAKISGKEVSSKRIIELLDLVGLKDRAKSKVKTYSHGMKQRLGIAQALLHDPELIVLDEPTTGLDPQGMKEIRDLILRLSKDENKTIFLSSHILSEIELVANRMIIINKGKKIVEGEVSNLLNSNKVKVTVEVENIVTVKNILETTKWLNQIESISANKININLEQNEIPLLNKFLVENGIMVNALVPVRSLEDYFLNITSGTK
ncbi:MAG: ABC transporter ATP-binding protein [Ignavibacteriota bacterium]|nr:MAG: ABC transporter ATP-binding protein [Chlorobiota bacterium]MBE7476987.1 ABC transporter ATP-binding protein [Ignavibacteriales bacterium]MBL1121763.1 ABC transporter ATP-binding protein [Ignavibacteriota bacterium]MCC7094300.1 ABC transporter ATP-binding protein [Ignavibacteriaceae bacterium]MCE7857392.1 ABC transporter ATP-binding protein [Ignavibacteria bacterium CHB3]MEB2296916.1 ABC transporter ATP-binding protein [Ignavibacteria bacterium]